MQDDVKINDICKLTGFMTHSSFIRAFKQKTEYLRANTEIFIIRKTISKPTVVIK